MGDRKRDIEIERQDDGYFPTSYAVARFVCSQCGTMFPVEFEGGRFRESGWSLVERDGEHRQFCSSNCEQEQGHG